MSTIFRRLSASLFARSSSTSVLRSAERALRSSRRERSCTRTRVSRSRTWKGFAITSDGAEREQLRRHILDGLRRHREHRHVAPVLVAGEPLEHGGAVAHRRRHVEQHEIGMHRAHLLEHALHRAAHDRDVVALLAQQPRERAGEQVIVVRDRGCATYPWPRIVRRPSHSMLPPLSTATVGPLGAHEPLAERRHRDRAARLDDELDPVEQEAHRAGERLVVDDAPPRRGTPGGARRGSCRSPSRAGRRRGRCVLSSTHRRAGRARARELGRAGGLDADHARVRHDAASPRWRRRR